MMKNHIQTPFCSYFSPYFLTFFSRENNKVSSQIRITVSILNVPHLSAFIPFQAPHSPLFYDLQQDFSIFFNYILSFDKHANFTVQSLPIPNQDYFLHLGSL
jgi:hypothetical protein